MKKEKGGKEGGRHVCKVLLSKVARSLLQAVLHVEHQLPEPLVLHHLLSVPLLNVKTRKRVEGTSGDSSDGSVA